MEFKDSKEAFQEAIAQGRLSTHSTDDNWAGNYMYMGTTESSDMFKHIDTREYLA